MGGVVRISRNFSRTADPFTWTSSSAPRMVFLASGLVRLCIPETHRRRAPHHALRAIFKGPLYMRHVDADLTSPSSSFLPICTNHSRRNKRERARRTLWYRPSNIDCVRSVSDASRSLRVDDIYVQRTAIYTM